VTKDVNMAFFPKLRKTPLSVLQQVIDSFNYAETLYLMNRTGVPDKPDDWSVRSLAGYRITERNY